MRGDVTDVAAMLDVFGAARPEAVYHLAAQIDVRRSVSDPSMDAHQNVGGTAAVLEAARSAGARRVILASTAGVYGDPPALPIAEDAEVAPLSPYGASKAAAESYLALFSRLYGVSTLALRMSNVYGPRQNPHGEAGVIAIFCAAAASGRAVTIFGDGTPDARLRLRRGRRAGLRRRRPLGRAGRDQPLDGRRDEPARPRARSGPRDRRRAGAPRRDRPLDPRPGRAARDALGWSASTPLAEGLERRCQRSLLAPAGARLPRRRAGRPTVTGWFEGDRLVEPRPARPFSNTHALDAGAGRDRHRTDQQAQRGHR